MGGGGVVKASCARCGDSFRIPSVDYRRESGEVYCQDCLVPFECDRCGGQKTTVPEKISNRENLICRDCQAGAAQTAGNSRDTGRHVCSVCDKIATDLIEFQEAPGYPVCEECAPGVRDRLQETNRGLVSVVSNAVGHLFAMLSYFVLSLGVSLYTVATFDLVWWLFLPVLGIFLLLGAQWSRIFDQQEIIDLIYATVLTAAAAWFVFRDVGNRVGLVICAITVSSIIVHELCHKAVGLGFGKFAQFRAFYTLNLVWMTVAYLTGFAMFSPGAVYFEATTDRAHGLVAAAGPVSNLLLAIGFIGVANVSSAFAFLGFVGIVLNLGLAGFNMLPIPPLDGAKVLQWSVGAYALIATPILVLVYELIASL